MEFDSLARIIDNNKKMWLGVKLNVGNAVKSPNIPCFKLYETYMSSAIPECIPGP